MKSQAALSRFWAGLKCDDCEALQNVETCHAVFRSRMTEIYRTLYGSINSVADSDAKPVVVEPEQAASSVWAHVSENGAEVWYSSTPLMRIFQNYYP